MANLAWDSHAKDFFVPAMGTMTATTCLPVTCAGSSLYVTKQAVIALEFDNEPHIYHQERELHARECDRGVSVPGHQDVAVL